MEISEEKRYNSFLEKINDYKQKQNIIKNALSSIDQKIPTKKIKFEDINKPEKNKNRKKKDKNEEKKLDLFDDDGNDDNDYNFEIKEQFEGKNGEKLLQLQTKFSSDKRFLLDSRFIDEDAKIETNGEQNHVELDDFEVDNVEKETELKILETIIGKNIRNKKPTSDKIEKGMLRFDPTAPEHSKFEIKQTEMSLKLPKKKQKKLKDPEPILEEIPESKEKFYKVTENLKEAFTEKQPFSLLSTFQTSENDLEFNEPEENIVDNYNTETIKKVKKKNPLYTANPFKYDSSDSENEDDKTMPTKSENVEKFQEKFFFDKNDSRLLEGLKFILSVQNKESNRPFEERRREIKQIVRHKYKNNTRKQQPFRKKVPTNPKSSNKRKKR